MRSRPHSRPSPLGGDQQIVPGSRRQEGSTHHEETSVQGARVAPGRSARDRGRRGFPGLAGCDAHLDIGSGTQGAQTGQIMQAFERYLLECQRPAGVIVVGDVNSTMAAALVSVKLQIPVAHVEAGLRCYDRAMPEEINRVVTDAVADVLLVSEPNGRENLAREGIANEKISYVGNVMIDSLCDQIAVARSRSIPAKFGSRTVATRC